MEPTTIGYGVNAGIGGTFGAKGFAPAFSNYALEGGQLLATQNLSHQFDSLWNSIVNCVPTANVQLLGQIKTKLDEAYMFTGRAIAQPVIGGRIAGSMTY